MDPNSIDLTLTSRRPVGLFDDVLYLGQCLLNGYIVGYVLEVRYGEVTRFSQFLWLVFECKQLRVSSAYEQLLAYLYSAGHI